MIGGCKLSGKNTINSLKSLFYMLNLKFDYFSCFFFLTKATIHVFYNNKIHILNFITRKHSQSENFYLDVVQSHFS